MILTIEIPSFDPFDVAVDSNQNIWVAGPNKSGSGGSIVGYNSAGEQRSQMSAGFSVPIHSLSLNDDGEIYATQNPYSSSSELLLITTDRGFAHPHSIDLSVPIRGANGIAVDNSDNVYVFQSIDMFQ